MASAEYTQQGPGAAASYSVLNVAFRVIVTIFLLSLIIISKELWIMEKRIKLIYKKQDHERLFSRAKMVTR